MEHEHVLLYFLVADFCQIPSKHRSRLMQIRSASVRICDRHRVISLNCGLIMLVYHLSNNLCYLFCFTQELRTKIQDCAATMGRHMSHNEGIV